MSVCEEQMKNYCIPSEQLSFAENLQSLIDDLAVVIISYDTNLNLVSSDVPVIAINPFHSPSIGYACMGLVILFPVSERKLVVLYDGKMYPHFRGMTYVKSNDCEEVIHLNTLQYISAEKILFSHSDKDFLFISESAENIRERNRAKCPVTTLGVDGNKVIATGMRTTIYKCDWSFAQVSHRFKRIPFVCKEAPPRKWDYKYEQQLNQRSEVLDMVFRASPQTFASYKITGKELRRGCKRMASAAKVYWSQMM